MAKNLAFTFYDSSDIAARQAEVPNADFHNGCNHGRSDLLGVCTGIYDFSEESFSYKNNDYVESMYIGASDPSSVVGIRDFVVGGSSQFVIAAQDTDAGDGFEIGLLNLTGVTVPAGSRAFGFRSP